MFKKSIILFCVTYRRRNNDRTLQFVSIATHSHLHNVSEHPLSYSCAFSHYMQAVFGNLSDLILLIVLVTLLTKDLADSIMRTLSYSEMTHACRW